MRTFTSCYRPTAVFGVSQGRVAVASTETCHAAQPLNSWNAECLPAVWICVKKLTQTKRTADRGAMHRCAMRSGSHPRALSRSLRSLN